MEGCDEQSKTPRAGRPRGPGHRPSRGRSGGGVRARCVGGVAMAAGRRAGPPHRRGGCAPHCYPSDCARARGGRSHHLRRKVGASRLCAGGRARSHVGAVRHLFHSCARSARPTRTQCRTAGTASIRRQWRQRMTVVSRRIRSRERPPPSNRERGDDADDGPPACRSVPVAIGTPGAGGGT